MGVIGALSFTFYIVFVPASPVDNSLWSNEPFSIPKANFKFIKTNGLSLNTLESGTSSGPLMILLHGLLTWRKQIDGLSNAGYHVIAPDMRGYNTSDKPEGLHNYSLDKLVADVIGIADTFNQSRFVLVGHDWGAIVAWHVAHKHPDRVSNLVIINVPHTSAMLDLLKEKPQQILLSWYMLWFQIPVLPELRFSQDNYSHTISAIFPSGIPQVTFSREDAKRHIDAWSVPNALTSMINYYRSLFRGSDVATSLETDPYLKVKTLIIWGEKDSVLLPDLAHLSIKYCPEGSKVVMIPNGTHWVPLEEPAKITHEIINFVKQ